MARKLARLQTGTLGGRLDDQRDALGGQSSLPHVAPLIDLSKDRAALDVAGAEPGLERFDWAGGLVGQRRDDLDLPLAFLVGLAALHGDDGLTVQANVGHVHVHQLRSAKRAGEPHQQQRLVALPGQRIRQCGDHLADLAERRRRLLGWRGAQLAANTGHDDTNIFIDGRVGLLRGTMGGRDRGQLDLNRRDFRAAVCQPREVVDDGRYGSRERGLAAFGGEVLKLGPGGLVGAQGVGGFRFSGVLPGAFVGGAERGLLPVGNNSRIHRFVFLGSISVNRAYR